MNIQSLFKKSSLLFIFALLNPLSNLAAQEPSTLVFVTPVAEVSHLNPQNDYWVGLHFKIKSDWHIYSNVEQDMGMPTQVNWTLPDGFSVEKEVWTQPSSFHDSDSTSSGYANELFVAAKIIADEDIEEGNYLLTADTEWLACGESCVPGDQHVKMNIPVKLNSTPIPNEEGITLFTQIRDSGGSSTPKFIEHPSWIGAIFFALIGGLILNLMPCVFPVLSLKILGFVKHAGDEPRKVKIHGIVFCLGVLLSFWALTGLLLGLRAAGEMIGWGFQLQSPTFLVILTSVLVLLSLNFAGVFEIGTSLISTGSRLGKQFGYMGSFSSGILATVLATPCTAPFMGSALGYALTLPAFYSLVIFTALAVGMMLPYLILSFSPSLLKFLPRPGPWMEKFKQAMAFPLLATVIWLLWVFGTQTDLDALCALLLGLLLVSLSAWIYGQFNTLTASFLRKLTSSATALAALSCGLYLGINAVEQSDNFTQGTDICVDGSYHQLPWMQYSEENLETLLSQNRPVLIDFTASWCLTCQVTKKQIFGSQDVINALKDKDIVILKADWTKRDPNITKALEKFGRSGVPTKVLYSGNHEKSPIVLPEVTNNTNLIEAIQTL